VGSSLILFFCRFERFCFVGRNPSWSFLGPSLLVTDSKGGCSIEEIGLEGATVDFVEDGFLVNEGLRSDRWFWEGDTEWGRDVETTVFQEGVDLNDYFNKYSALSIYSVY
jgi:hypothetical protein